MVRKGTRHGAAGAAGAVLSACLLAGVGGLGGVAGVLVAPGGPAGAASSSSSSQYAQAKTSLILLSDLPQGWTAPKATGDSKASGRTVPGAAQLATCLGVAKDVIENVAPTESSPSFASKNGQQSAQDSVTIDPSATAAKASYASIAGAKTPGCLNTILNGVGKQTLAGSLQAGETIGTITVSDTAPAALAPHSAGFTIAVPITYKSQVVNSQITIIDVAKGHEESELTLTSVRSPFPAALSKHLAQVALQRLPAT
jgi:hypothetical protein